MAAEPNLIAPSGTTALILGADFPAISNEETAVQFREAVSPDSKFITVTYRPLEDWLEQWETTVDELSLTVRVVVVGETTHSPSVRLAKGQSSSRAQPTVTTISDPTKISELGITLDLYLDEWTTEGSEIVVCFDSLSALLEKTDAAVAFRFMHFLVVRIRSLGARALVLCDPAKLSEKTLRTFTPLFDTIIESEGETLIDPKPLTLDRTLDLLRVAPRRRILRALAEADGPVDLIDLATRLAAVADGTSPEEVSDERHKQMLIALRHSHLPKLEECSVIGVDDEAMQVRRARQFSGVLRYLDAIDEIEPDGDETD